MTESKNPRLSEHLVISPRIEARIELAEVRAALKEAHLLYTNWNVDESFRTFEKFFEAHYKTLQAREAELLARGGGK